MKTHTHTHTMCTPSVLIESATSLWGNFYFESCILQGLLITMINSHKAWVTSSRGCWCVCVCVRGWTCNSGTAVIWSPWPAFTTPESTCEFPWSQLFKLFLVFAVVMTQLQSPRLRENKISLNTSASKQPQKTQTNLQQNKFLLNYSNIWLNRELIWSKDFWRVTVNSSVVVKKIDKKSSKLTLEIRAWGLKNVRITLANWKHFQRGVKSCGPLTVYLSEVIEVTAMALTTGPIHCLF